MNIQKYSSKDEQVCSEVFLSNSPKYFVPYEIERFRNWLKDSRHYYVLKENGRVIGCGGFDINDKENKVTLSWGMIHSGFHKRGYGTKFIKYRLKLIKDLKKETTVVLDTSQHTFKFYEKLGFKLDKITKNYYGKGLDRYDMSMQIK